MLFQVFKHVFQKVISCLKQGYWSQHWPMFHPPGIMLETGGRERVNRRVNSGSVPALAREDSLSFSMHPSTFLSLLKCPFGQSLEATTVSVLIRPKSPSSSNSAPVVMPVLFLKQCGNDFPSSDQVNEITVDLKRILLPVFHSFEYRCRFGAGLVCHSRPVSSTG